MSDVLTQPMTPGICPLGKKRTRQIRVDDDVADMADRLASLQEPPQSVPDFLSEYLRPLLRRDLAKALDRARKHLDETEEEEG